MKTSVLQASTSSQNPCSEGASAVQAQGTSATSLPVSVSPPTITAAGSLPVSPSPSTMTAAQSSTTALQSTPTTTLSTSQSERPTPVMTATRKKLALSKSPLVASPQASSSPAATNATSCQGSSSSTQALIAGEEGVGYRALKLELLAVALANLAQCKFCQSPLELSESFVHRKGLITSVKIMCSNKECRKFESLSDPQSTEATAVNRAALLAARLTGNGRSTLDTITAFLSMPPPLSPASYSVYNKEIGDASLRIAESRMVEASNNLHRVMGEPLDKVVDVIVTVDGTWQKRGHSSLFGVIVVIAWKTGQVLDREVLSKHCSACSVRESMGMDPVEFQTRYQDHKPKCDADYEGSSGNMEVVDTERMWQRSVAARKLRYTTIISDGDSKAFNNLEAIKPYGPDVQFIKHECVGHVQKRMYYALSTLKKSAVFDDDGNRVKFGGRLTNESMKAMNLYYGGAIRNNVGSVDGMIKDIDATFFHCLSTDEHPIHKFCPTGIDSWCKHNKAIANKEPPPKHKPKIPRDLAKYVRPVFIKLMNRDLLERCTLGATQNQNESFNKLVWSKASKTQFLSKPTISLAVNLSIITFNEGMEKGLSIVLRELGVQLGPRTLRFFRASDKMRLSKSDRMMEEVAKKRRKAKARAKATEEDRHQAREGPTYGAGQF